MRLRACGLVCAELLRREVYIRLYDPSGDRDGEGNTSDAARSLRKLAALTRRMEALEKLAVEEKIAAPELLEDEARTLRSQIRMWGKDAERYMRREGGGAGSSWLGWLEDLRKGL